MNRQFERRQAAILAYLRTRELRPPSYREIMAATGTRGLSTIAYHLNALAARGLIEREHGKHRAIRVTTREDSNATT